MTNDAFRIIIHPLNPHITNMKANPTKVAQELINSVSHTRVFLSMPYMEGITPVCMDAPHVRKFQDANSALERRDGYFALNEAGLSPLDHGNLYGDAVFEGIRIDNRRILMLREHVDRWLTSAQKLEIVDIPSFGENGTHETPFFQHKLETQGGIARIIAQIEGLFLPPGIGRCARGIAGFPVGIGGVMETKAVFVRNGRSRIGIRRQHLPGTAQLLFLRVYPA